MMERAKLTAKNVIIAGVSVGALYFLYRHFFCSPRDASTQDRTETLVSPSATTSNETNSLRPELIQVAASSFKLGSLTVPHRICMAPMTRRRCPDRLAGSDDQVAYYSARAAGAGANSYQQKREQQTGFSLIFTEGTYINEALCGTEDIPHIGTDVAAQRWKIVVDAVKKASDGQCKFAVQLWHPGRLCTAIAVGPEDSEFTLSAVPPTVRKVRKLSSSEQQQIADEFASAAKRAVAISNFDAVALHSAHGYLMDSLFPAPQTPARHLWRSAWSFHAAWWQQCETQSTLHHRHHRRHRASTRRERGQKGGFRSLFASRSGLCWSTAR